MLKYCSSIYKTQRWTTREVLVGNIGVGGDNPIRIQSMTTSNTRDIQATIDQVVRLADAGCEIVRVTVQGMKEADACEEIKNGLLKRGYTTPLVADIHFYPPAALRVVDFAEKVRVNPGNFVDKRASFKIIEYDDASYALELEKIEEKFTPLVLKCKRLNRAMRIGTNHGSLSDRIMNRYGDSPMGMVESALEFARVCRTNDFHNIIFSMKASNPQVMMQAYRLLVSEMISLGWNYPLHLGVTEAGQGEDGRIKSAMGMGSLLLDGIGDTIRVSLTENAWNEIDPCKRLIKLADSYEGKGVEPFEESHRHIETITRRPVIFPKDISLHRDGSVIVGIKQEELQKPDIYAKLGLDVQFGRPKLKISSVDGLIITQKNKMVDQKSKHLKDIGISIFSENPEEGEIALLSLKDAATKKLTESMSDRFAIYRNQSTSLAVVIKDETPQQWEILEDIKPALIILSPKNFSRLHYCRHFFDWLQTKNISAPVILNFNYTCSQEDLIIQSSAELGALLCDGMGNGIWIDAPFEIGFLRNLSFNILQAARMRSFKTDFISCPSCGRTLFDLQDVSKRIRERTDHLPGVKIAIMGCIVNGPGEMADADFGYVGSKPGMIDLYVGKACVEKDISFADADERLVELIKKHGRWVEKSESYTIV
ncbi:MAG: (E)-4-hydroxy-3-methylbut-2-enyl-diphosphate synthase [Parachlamydiaceae bacterium]|nr:(E)-4-hydroxy-3-methylbut-2-enyl-diphosphate synthase [Parachlamydiaceae bacterium]